MLHQNSRQEAQAQEPQAVILIGHGSLRSDSGVSMFRIAEQLQTRGIAPLVKAAFLNYSHPTLAETVETLLPLGITEITIQPYFLIAGVYVQNDLRTLIEDVNEQFPTVSFHIAPVLGEHHALTALAQWRVEQAQEQLAATTGIDDAPALLLMAHGTPRPSANAPLYTIAEKLVARLALSDARVSYLDCNTPSIPKGIDQLVESGAKQIIALPYFLHLGRHVAEDLPEIIAEAQAKHSNTVIHLAHHLDYDLRLVDAVEGLLPLAKPLHAPLHTSSQQANKEASTKPNVVKEPAPRAELPLAVPA